MTKKRRSSTCIKFSKSHTCIKNTTAGAVGISQKMRHCKERTREYLASPARRTIAPRSSLKLQVPKQFLLLVHPSANTTSASTWMREEISSQFFNLPLLHGGASISKAQISRPVVKTKNLSREAFSSGLVTSGVSLQLLCLHTVNIFSVGDDQRSTTH